MLTFFRTRSIDSLKNKLVLVYFLNAIDILFTFGLLKTGLFVEANTLMVSIVEDTFLSILIKLIIPALLIIYILIKLNQLDETPLPICHIAVNTVIVLYSCIMLLHLSYTAYFVYSLVAF